MGFTIRSVRRATFSLVAGMVLALCGCVGNPMVPSATFQRDDAADVLKQYREQMAQQRAGTEEAAARKRAEGPRTMDDLLSEGDRFRRQGEHTSALISYLRAYRNGGGDLLPLERIGFLHLRNDPGHAELIFEEVLGSNPDSASAHTGLGLASFAQGRLAPARRSFERAIELDPDAAAPRSALGVLLDQIGEREAAQASFQRAHQLQPDDYSILNNLGICHLLAGEYEAATEAFRVASQQEPRDASVRNNLGLALGRLGRYDDALKEFRAAGDEAEAQNNLGYVYYLNGEYEKAIEHLKRALDVRGEKLLVVLRNLELAQNARSEPERPAGPQARPTSQLPEAPVAARAAGELPTADPISQPAEVVAEPQAVEEVSEAVVVPEAEQTPVLNHAPAATENEDETRQGPV